ncbi:glutamine-synthetase adenylyltransferase [Roseovarius sp. THAF27]|uniref:[protein-PII] uridylyltransferase family protein n=1 Tax=Roseovarius sp. THAF27 TaxID=2587850 RepID=UPI00126954EF|nr:glutamine-synthetase adenylyltransferase [Roseovarius sp. THAF27]
MSFSARMSRCPRPHDPEPGQEARQAMPGLSEDLGALVEGTAGCSPYLHSLCLKEREWLPEVFSNPEAAFEALLKDVDDIPFDEAPPRLRRLKARVALLVAMCDLGGVWDLEEVTHALTRFADRAVRIALQAALLPELRRGKIPGQDESMLEEAAGMVVLAMGKMGAYELNYSSDIDLICLFDETRFNGDAYHEARTGFVRATRRMAATLNDRTADGYVFRTDLRLRPDPNVTPVCMAMGAAETYYESLGRTWERAAYIKARAAAGDPEAGARFLDTLRPFVWRKHLDFTAIEDAHNMRLRIREHKGLHGPIRLDGHNMKLGRGGIREIEFFTQTRQLISGGRDPDLRVRGTVEGLARLAEKNWVPGDAAGTLTENYRFHREIEHRLQMLRDAQTQILPDQADGWTRLANFCDRDEKEFRDELTERLQTVHDLIEGFFAPEGTSERPAKVEGLDEEVIARWRNYPALRSERANTIFDRLKPDLLERLSRSSTPQDALIAFDGFLAGLPAGVQVFALFEANPQLIDLMVDIAGISPALASYLSRHAGVFDAVIAGDFFAPWPDEQHLRKELAARLDREEDYERKLDAARRWQKEWHFRTGVHLLRGLIDADKAGAQYADLAQVILAEIWKVVCAHFAEKHGPPPGRGAVVLGMGSLGAGKLNAASDLDLIVIYDAEGVERSEGRRALATRPYYARLTQALITALTAPMSEGRLYEVDMRLRPSGNQGPVATSWTSFQTYQQEEAWVWEHLALTRARAVAGPDALAGDVEAFRCSLLQSRGDKAKVLSEVAEMRARIAAAKSSAGAWDTKLGSGRMQEIELVAQAGCLLAGQPERSVEAGLTAGVAAGWLSDADEAALKAAYRLCWQVTQAARLLGDKPIDEESLGAGAKSFILRQTGHDSMSELRDDLDARTRQAGLVIDAALNKGCENG